MILYFSGTGNSRYVAEAIARASGDSVVSINDQIKQECSRGFASSSHPYVFVCPTYAWRLPRVVEAFIRSSKFTGSSKAYFVMTCGTDTQNAVSYIERLCVEKGWKLQGFAGVVMPENYIAMFPTSDPGASKQIIAKADPVIAQIVESIGRGEKFPTPAKCGTVGKLQSGIVNSVFYRLFVHSKGFYATAQCSDCGQCATLCPLNNIQLRERRPVWGERCTHCMACICGCPKEAIEYKKKSQGKPRYYLAPTKKQPADG